MPCILRRLEARLDQNRESQAASWNLRLPAPSFLIREHELVAGESEAGTDAPGSVSGAAGAAASVGSGSASSRRLAFDVRPCVSCLSAL